MPRIEIISETDEGAKSRMIVTATRQKLQGEDVFNLQVEFDPELDMKNPDAHPDPLGIQQAVCEWLARGEKS